MELKKNGFTIEKEGDNFMIAFPKDKATIWEEFITKHLEIGYWNEYLTEDKVIYSSIHMKVIIKSL